MAFGPVSGAHFNTVASFANPAVTVGRAFTRVPEADKPTAREATP